MIMSFLPMLFGGFSEVGYSDGPAPHRVPMSPAAFRNAPQYAEGTANTSGIPAVLHPNEAPLSKGRQVPVDIGGAGAAQITHAGNTFNIDVNVDGGSGDDDQERAANIGKAIRMQLEGMIEDKLLEHSQYGGMLNQR